MAKASARSRSKTEPTSDQIAVAILQMLDTLKLVDDMPGLPFPENVKRAIADFDKPKLRTSLSRRLYRPERYVP